MNSNAALLSFNSLELENLQIAAQVGKTQKLRSKFGV